jgi:hypothetical protein
VLSAGCLFSFAFYLVLLLGSLTLGRGDGTGTGNCVVDETLSPTDLIMARLVALDKLFQSPIAAIQCACIPVHTISKSPRHEQLNLIYSVIDTKKPCLWV